MIPSSACPPWPSEQSSNPTEDRHSYTTPRGTISSRLDKDPAVLEVSEGVAFVLVGRARINELTGFVVDAEVNEPTVQIGRENLPDLLHRADHLAGQIEPTLPVRG